MVVDRDKITLLVVMEQMVKAEEAAEEEMTAALVMEVMVVMG